LATSGRADSSLSSVAIGNQRATRQPQLCAAITVGAFLLLSVGLVSGAVLGKRGLALVELGPERNLGLICLASSYAGLSAANAPEPWLAGRRPAPGGRCRTVVIVSLHRRQPSRHRPASYGWFSSGLEPEAGPE